MVKRIRITDEASESLKRMYEDMRGTKTELASEAILQFEDSELDDDPE